MKMISVPVFKAGVIVACIVGLAGCGGGGGGVGGGAAASSVVVAPLKGKFSAGATVTFRRLDGTVLGTGMTLADGTAPMPSISGYTGPVLVEVGNPGATYYDEVSGNPVAFAGAPLRALVPALSDGARIAVTLATNAAVAMVEAGAGGIAGTNASAIALANAKVAVALGLGSSADILQAPTLIDGSTSNLSVSNVADQYALRLAAFALSPSSGATALDAARDIAKDLSDGIFDGLYSDGGVPTAIGGGYVIPSTANMQAHIQAAANQYAAAESRELINAAPGNWVQVVADVTTGVTPPATGTAAYLAQAKGMFAELRSIFSFYSDSTDTGFLNVQRQRITNDLTNTVAPSLGLTADRVVLMANGMQMAVDITGSVVSTAIAGLPATPVYLTQNDLQLRQDGGGNYYFWRQVGASNGDDTISCASNAFSQSAWTTAASSGAVPAGFHIQCDGSAATGVVGGANLARFHTIIEKTGSTSFDYKAWRTLVATEAVDGRSGTAPNYTYAYTGTVAAQFGNINNPDSLALALINGSLPRSQEGAAGGDLLNANVELSQSGNVNTLTIAGSLQSLNGSGTALSTFTLEQGTQVLGAVDSGLVTAVTFVGEARTANTKFNGTLELGSFLMDASETYLMPTSITFEGSMADTSSGGTTPFLSGTLGLTVGNQSSFNATQPNSQSNFRTFTATFNGNVTAPAHPVTTLVFNGSQHTGTNLISATLTFTRANINITGSASQDGSGTQTLSLTNQDGIQVAKNTSGSGYLVTKSGVALATITNDGVIIYVDGTGGSL